MPNLTWKLHLKSPPQKVYTLLNSKQGRASFWAESAEEKNGVITFKFINGIIYKSKILKRVPNSIFELDYFNSVVTFKLAENEIKGTDLTLENTAIPQSDYLEVYAGWLSVLFALKGAADFGIDLRNHDTKRTWDQLYIEN